MPENVSICINPATGEKIGEVPLDTVDDLKQAIARAREAQKIWRDLPPAQRARKIIRIRDYLVDNMDRLAETIARDTAKVRLDALATEVFAGVLAVSYYCRRAKKFFKDKKAGIGVLPLINKRAKLIRVPYGVIGIISPWNYPFGIPFHDIIQGLLAGNAVILKTATETLQVGLALKEAVEAAELPEGLFHFINLPGRVAGHAFLENGIDKLFFIGSVAVGKILMAKAAETLTPINLELGGNDAMIVCEDADLERAANGAVWAGFSNAGQSCGGVERIYVHKNVYDEFLSLLKEKVEQLRIGYDSDFEKDMGPIISEKQVKSIKMHVDEALQNGAVIYAQSKLPDNKTANNLLPAMILTNVTHRMDVMKHETFGPVIGVMPFSDEEEAVALANDSYLGLSGSVWSKNRKKAERIARRIQAGSVCINDHLMNHGMPETSWHGFKQSGIGHSHGPLGFEEMTQPQYIINDILPGVKRDLWWQPYGKNVYEGLRGTIQFFYGKGLGRRLKGLGPMMKILPRMFKR